MACQRQVAVYGGSFQPPHVGHAMVVGWLRWTGLADEVWLVPVGAHAFGKALWPFEERLALCEAMAADVGAFVRVDPIEGRQPGVSYTVKTLDALAAAHPDARFRLVIGADQWAQRAAWRDWDRIADVYAPIVVGRGGFPPVAGAPVFPELSSTSLRERLAAGEPVAGLVTRSVAERLRRTGRDRQGPSPITP